LPGLGSGAPGAEMARLAGLDRDDWWIDSRKRERAWAALRVAELDASFAARVAEQGEGKKKSGKGFGKAAAAAAPPPAAAAGPTNPYRVLLAFADDARIRELAALDADDLLFLADMERCGWGDDDCLVKWTLHPRVGPRLRATATGGGFGGSDSGSGFGFDGSGGRLQGSARGGAGAFFGGELPESLRRLMEEARAAAEAERVA